MGEREKNKAVEYLSELDQQRDIRGQQLRALVISWNLGRSFNDVIDEQTEQIESGDLTLSEDWSVMAQEILAQYMSCQGANR